MDETLLTNLPFTWLDTQTAVSHVAGIKLRTLLLFEN